MKVTYNWLKEFVDFDLSPAELADLLTMLGLEVEGMESQGSGMDDVVVAVVEEKRQHPNADKLSVCRVNDGSATIDVVCGAQNFNAGDTVALAKVGAVLPGDFKIKKSKIRGEESCGMLCSEKELGLAEDSSGIMILPKNLVPGTPLFEALEKKDTFFEIGLTPNRADCLSTIGIAREIAAKLGTAIRYPETAVIEGNTQIAEITSVSVEDQELCPRYAARFVSGCRIAPSPEWLVKRLNSVGIRSINNVVDVTNLVMMELGQPLHAFDSDHLSGRRIVVRRALEGEPFITLDNQQRNLLATDLVICDADRPVALAGIMGGLNSEITDNTTSILLESASFKPSAIRATSKRLGLHTESSHRFERGIDTAGVTRALDRAAALIVELSGGEAARGVIDIHDGAAKPLSIPFRPDRANAILGILMPQEEMLKLLSRLECVVNQLADGTIVVTPPSYRMDLEREIDLIEEVARLNGFDKIPATMPMAHVDSGLPTPSQLLESNIRNFLIAHGMNEVINFSFTTIAAADKLMLMQEDPRRAAIKLTNPLIEEHSVMRTTLLPGLLETVARNHSFRTIDLKLLEMRRIYMPGKDNGMPHEPLCIAAALTGSREREGWCQNRGEIDFFDVKGVLENLLEHISIPGVRWVADTPEPYYHPGKSCSIMVGRERIGTVGEIHPTVQEAFSIDKPVYCFELIFDKLVKLQRPLQKVTAPSRFPDSSRDIALLMAEDVTAESVIDCIRSVKDVDVENIELFDVYRGTGIPEGHKSMAVRISYRSYERTLTEDEINSFHGQILERLLSKIKATLR